MSCAPLSLPLVRRRVASVLQAQVLLSSVTVGVLHEVLGADMFCVCTGHAATKLRTSPICFTMQSSYLQSSCCLRKIDP